MADLPPSKKTTRYDRQLRLWGDHGQSQLEKSHVCLINASATGTEILKNVVLPGIGAFTIVDDNLVTIGDLGNNFFLDEKCVGKPRGASASELLQELNDEVTGKSIEKNAALLLKESPEIFKSFSVVVATELAESTLLELAAVLWSFAVPLLVARSYGFLGYLRLACAEHCVTESHPDNAHHDLRVDVPFAGLTKFVGSFDLNTLDSTEHSHVPFIVLLLKWVDIWKESHNGEMPKSYAEKKQFKELLRQGIRLKENGAQMDEENFDEAIKNVNTALVATSVPSSVTDLLDSLSCTTNLTSDSASFWFLVRALKEFIAAEGNMLLPVRGSIPDMTASSKWYIEMQKVYQEQATVDAKEVKRHLDLLPVKTNAPIALSEVKHFCKNAAFLRVVHSKSLAEEYNPTTFDSSTIAAHLAEQGNLIVYYILLRAADRFLNTHGYYPGGKLVSIDDDCAQLQIVVEGLLKELRLPGDCVGKDCVMEMCRYGGVELHSVAAYIGGVAAQEVIKLITHQYVPFSNAYVYNASTSSSITIKL